MAFDYIVCTEELFQELGLPESMRIREGDIGNVISLVGSSFLYDPEIPAALIPDPECPRTGGSGRLYTLVIDNRHFRVCLERKCKPEQSEITAGIDEKNEDFDFDLLKQVLLQVFKRVLGDDDQCKIFLPKRYSLPWINRPYPLLIAKLNAVSEHSAKISTFVPEELRKTLPVQVFLACVLAEELEGFLALGRRVSWEGASQDSRDVIDSFLAADPKEVKRIFRWADN